MAAERVALLDDIEPPPYEHGQPNSQERPPGAMHMVEGGSSQPTGYPPQDDPGHPSQSHHGYPPQADPGHPSQSQYGYLPSQGHVQPLYAPQQLQPVVPNAITTQNVMVMQSGCTTVVPAVYPDDNCVYAWLVCLCCFWPLGIASIVYASRARDAVARGDYVAAMTHSRDSRRFSYWAIGVHLIAVVIGIPLLIVYIILGAASAAATSTDP